MRLPAAGGAYREGRERRVDGGRQVVHLVGRRLSDKRGTGRRRDMFVDAAGRHQRADNAVLVDWDLAARQRYTGGALNLAKIGVESAGPVAPMHRDLALQVRQRKCRLPIAAIGGAED